MKKSILIPGGKERILPYYGEKASCFDVKVDEQNELVSGYFAAFGNIDSDADIIMKGAFDTSIKAHGPQSTSNRKIQHLAYHSLQKQVGALQDLFEDEKGLGFVSKPGSHTLGRDSLAMYKEGIIREHSIGFEYMGDKMEFIAMSQDEIDKIDNVEARRAAEMYGGIFKLHEVRLFEGSYVTFGANSETPNLSIIKSEEDKVSMLDEYNERMSNLVKALKIGSLSDLTKNNLEMELLQIQKGYNSIARFTPIDLKQEVKNQQDETPKKGGVLTNIINQF